ncbi:acyl carrier protein (plasmid) [Streptomyces sp. BI20]|uniref:acyl carrier protein n=1 Tax=Streptomyces sp. BI20 TaxID=3403460 RepID=UPI003C7238EC
MSHPEFTLADLHRVLLEGAGAEEDEFDGVTDFLDTDFEVLGFESLAMLETIARIEREYEVTLGEDVFTHRTPRALITAVNTHLHTHITA